MTANAVSALPTEDTVVPAQSRRNAADSRSGVMSANSRCLPGTVCSPHGAAGHGAAGHGAAGHGAAGHGAAGHGAAGHGAAGHGAAGHGAAGHGAAGPG